MMMKKDKEDLKIAQTKIGSLLNKLEDLDFLTPEHDPYLQEAPSSAPPEFMKYAHAKHVEADLKTKSQQDEPLGSNNLPFEIPRVDSKNAHQPSPTIKNHLSETIEATTQIIKELIEVNDTLKKNAREAISALETQLSNEQAYSSHIFNELDQIKKESESARERDAHRIQELERLVSILSAKLKQSMQELHASKDWFDHLNKSINDGLIDAIRVAEKILNKD